MTKGQVVVLCLLELWVGAVTAFFLALWSSETGTTVAGVGFVVVVVLVPAAIAVFLWLWFDDQEISQRRWVSTLLAPFVVVGCVVGGPFLAKGVSSIEWGSSPADTSTTAEASGDTSDTGGLNRPRCAWTWAVDDSLAEVLAYNPTPDDSLSERGEELVERVRQLVRVRRSPLEYAVWIEDEEITVTESDLSVEGVIRNESRETIELTAYQTYFLSDDGDRIGQVYCSVDQNELFSEPDCGFTTTWLRPGFVSDLEATPPTYDRPSIARRDTVEFYVRYCVQR